MLLDRSIAIENMLHVAIHFSFSTLNGLLACAFISLINLINYLINYLSIIKVIFDIVSRAVKADIRENMPTARTNKEYYEYGRIRFLAVIASYCNDAFAIAREKPSSAVFNILLCKILECEVNYAK